MTIGIGQDSARQTTDGDAIRNIEIAGYPYHDFWLLHEGERDYNDYFDFIGRKDAPIRIEEYTFCFLQESFFWVPTVSAGSLGQSDGFGLNHFSPTIINQSGGEKLCGVCEGWAQILRQAPETLILSKGWVSPAVEVPQWEQFKFKTSRDKLVADLSMLADFGRKAATGEWFILHLGV